MFAKLLNFVVFQAIWFLGVFYHNHFLWLSFALFLAYQLYRYVTLERQQYKLELGYILSVAILGYLGDSLLLYAEVFQLNTSMPVLTVFVPAWLGLIWLAFASTLTASLGYLSRLPWGMQAILGAVFGPLAYLLPSAYSGLALKAPYLPHMLVLSVYWAVLTCFLMRLKAVYRLTN